MIRSASYVFVMMLSTVALGADFHVAPRGDDSAAGSADAPFATVQRAVDAVRELRKREPNRDTPVVVEMAGGVYRVTEPVRLGAADSGSAKSPTVYRAAKGTEPVVSGGHIVDGWKVGPDGVWETVIDAVRAGDWTFRELFVNGVRRQRARHPNSGYVRVKKVGADRRTSFTFNPGDIPATITKDAHGDLELVFLHDWSMSRVGVKAIDHDTHTLTTRHSVGPRAKHYAMDHFEKQPRYALENHPSLLDAPGEWYLNRRTGVLRYKPMAGETLDAAGVVAPVATALLEVRGEAGKPVTDVRFEGVAFEHCAWSLPPGGYAAGQACYHEQRHGEVKGNEIRDFVPAAVTFEIVERCAFVNGRVAHVGTSGLWFGSRAKDCVIERSTFTDISGNGVMLGEDTRRSIPKKGSWWRVAADEAATGNAVRDCVIERVGQQFYGAVGVWAGIVRDTRIEHNTIRHTPYTGVSIGWMWNPTPTPARNNTTSHNHIHHVMQVLSDGGGIYTLGRQPGSKLVGNHIHDVPLNAGRAESNGMFLDEGTTDVLIEGNVIHGIDRSPLRFHRATTNLVKGNVLVVGKGVPPVRYNATDPKHINLVDNATVPQQSFDVSKHAGLTSRAGVRRER